MTTRKVFLLDLVDDGDAIAAYEHAHAPGRVPTAVTNAIRANGVVTMELYRTGDRVVMIVEVDDGYDQDRKAAVDASDPATAAWEQAMDVYQRPLRWAEPGKKWTVAERFFSLDRSSPEDNRQREPTP